VHEETVGNCKVISRNTFQNNDIRHQRWNTPAGTTSHKHTQANLNSTGYPSLTKWR